MSFESLERKTIRLIRNGDTQQVETMIKETKSILKICGAAAWSWVLVSKNRDAMLELFYKHKAPVYLPKFNSKRFTADSDYTLLLAINHECESLVDYLIKNYKLPARLLSDSIALLCNKKAFDSQLSILKKLINAGGDVQHKNQKAMFNATFNENSTIIPTLVEHGSYLINQTSAILFLQELDADPMTHLLECTDTRSHEAIMEVIAAEKVDDLPINHYGGNA